MKEKLTLLGVSDGNESVRRIGLRNWLEVFPSRSLRVKRVGVVCR